MIYRLSFSTTSRSALCILSTLLVGLAWGALPAIAEGSDGLEACQRIELETAPHWATGFLQSHDGSSVLVADLAADSVVRYARDGKRLETLDGAARFTPSGLAAYGDDYLVETGNARFHVLKARREDGRENFATRSASSLVEGSPLFELESARLGRDLASLEARAGDIAKVYGWVPIGSRGLVAHADLLFPGAVWKSGIISTSLDDPRQFTLLKELPLGSAERTVAIYLKSGISAGDGEAYVLVQGESPALYVYDVEARGSESFRKLAPLPAPYDVAPRLPRTQGEKGLTKIFDALASTTMAVELHSRPSGLYLLARVYDEESGEREWFVHRLEITDGEARLASTVRLPTSAEHVTLAPGRDVWLALERGAVRGYLDQEIPSMLSVPAAWIEAGATNLRFKGATIASSCS